MNIAGLRLVADAIEKHEVPGLGFNMVTYGDRGSYGPLKNVGSALRAKWEFA